MSAQKKFGGDWSDKKLLALREYLSSWALVLKNSDFKKVYIDAFAGAGIQEIEDNAEQSAYRHGSPFIALETRPHFNEFVFIEKNQGKLDELRAHIESSAHCNRTIHYRVGDANAELTKICREFDAVGSRAVAFLDPFALQVDWSTIQALAKTKAIDVWLLFSAMAANRMMTRNGRLNPGWKEKLDRTFGCSDWPDEFYRTEEDLFGPQTVKNEKPYEIMSQFVTKRLATEFEAANETPLILKNSSNTPIFLFCFACGNPAGAGPARRIANHIIQNKN